MKHMVHLLKPDIVATNVHGDEVKRPQSPVKVPAAGWSEPSDEAKASFKAPDHITYSLDLHAKAGAIDVGNTVVVDGVTFQVVGKTNYDHGPFGFTPGLDVLKLGRSSG